MQITEHPTDQLLSRRAVAKRWGVSIMTIKRREREGLLRAVRFSRRLVRYRLADVEQCEREASAASAFAKLAAT